MQGVQASSGGIDTLAEFLALVVTLANEQDREKVEDLARQVQEVMGDIVVLDALEYVHQGYTGYAADATAEGWGIRLQVVTFPEARKGFMLLPCRRMVERSFRQVSRFRRLTTDYECLPEMVKGPYLITFSTLMLARVIKLVHNTSAQQALR